MLKQNKKKLFDEKSLCYGKISNFVIILNSNTYKKLMFFSTKHFYFVKNRKTYEQSSYTF